MSPVLEDTYVLIRGVDYQNLIPLNVLKPINEQVGCFPHVSPRYKWPKGYGRYSQCEAYSANSIITLTEQVLHQNQRPV